MNIYDYTVKNNKGEQVSLSTFKGQVLLIVNTATGCGFTPQYKALQSLYETYGPQGFTILDFPCNQFGNQAPGSASEIADFCELKYHTTFPQFAKIDVNGVEEEPLFTYLKAAQPGKLTSDIKWNFTKFLVDRSGQVIARFAPSKKPEQLAQAIEQLL